MRIKIGKFELEIDEYIVVLGMILLTLITVFSTLIIMTYGFK